MSEKEPKNWFVYLIEASDTKLYAGITKDVPRRWQEHHSGVKGAKFFRGRKPQKLLYMVVRENRSEASKLEYQIKQLSRKQKLALIESEENKALSMLPKL